MSEKKLVKLEERMRQISLLLANQILFTFLLKKTQTEKIIFLSKIGFDNKEISLLVDTTLSAVSARLSEYRKKQLKTKTHQKKTKEL